MRYRIGKQDVDSVELKCLLVSRGLKISPEVYKTLGEKYRIYPNALTCNCLKLPDETVVMIGIYGNGPEKIMSVECIPIHALAQF